MKFQGRGLLLDIEGTTSSVRFVYDVMFPYVRERLNDFLQRKLDSDDVQQALQVLSVEAGHDSFDAWRALHRDQSRAELVGAEVVRLMDADAKTTGLKQLQGLIWEDGFRSGTLVAHVYDEVPEQLRRWASEGWDIRIYSSGSRHAQLLFFGHTTAGDLLHLFRGHYDTTIGGKKSAGSYAQNRGRLRLAAGSDSVCQRHPRRVGCGDGGRSCDGAERAARKRRCGPDATRCRPLIRRVEHRADRLAPRNPRKATALLAFRAAGARMR